MLRELLRGAMQMHILHHAAEDGVHGAWMAEELSRHGYEVSPGTLYPTLHRLEEQGLLVSRRQVVDGKTLRIYIATPKGKQALAEARRTLSELVDEVLGGETGTGVGQ